MRQPRFDISRPLVAARGFTFAGKTYAKGDPFPIDGIDPRMVLRQYETLSLIHI